MHFRSTMRSQKLSNRLLLSLYIQPIAKLKKVSNRLLESKEGENNLYIKTNKAAHHKIPELFLILSLCMVIMFAIGSFIACDHFKLHIVKVKRKVLS